MTNSISSSKQRDLPWPLLFRLWREFMSEPYMPLLDRWLKQQFKQSTGIPLAQQLLLSRALMDAMAFMQLACALEHGYQQQALDLDWDAWDSGWHFDQVKKIPASNLWFWLGRRCELDVNELRIPDMHERNQFFESAQGRVTEISVPTLNAWSLLWYAMRPCWKALLNERAVASQWFPGQLRTFIDRQTQMPPLWLRPQQQSTVETVAAALRQEGVDIALTAEGYVCAKGGKGVANTRAYKEGLVEIQDLASQQIAASVAAKPGQKVWDTCAGAGGKSLAIAARMHNKGMLLATDLHERKLDELKRRAKRAQLFNLRTFTWNGSAPLRLPKEAAQQQGFDWVLVDAPCSSAGTWRRNPDARWRFNEADTRELIALQRRILTHAAGAVRSGGHLVYATCSWQVSENEAQVDWFVQNHPGFKLDYQRLPGSPLEDADTMFVAVLVLSP